MIMIIIVQTIKEVIIITLVAFFNSYVQMCCVCKSWWLNHSNLLAWKQLKWRQWGMIPLIIPVAVTRSRHSFSRCDKRVNSISKRSPVSADVHIGNSPVSLYKHHLTCHEFHEDPNINNIQDWRGDVKNDLRMPWLLHELSLPSSRLTMENGLFIDGFSYYLLHLVISIGKALAEASYQGCH